MHRPTDWSDVVARVSGLASRLVAERTVLSLREQRSLAGLSSALASLQILPAPLERAGPRDLELAIRRHAAGCMRLLARWAGRRVDLLAPLFEDEERRSLRAVLRGAVSGTPPELRLSGLIPTPRLPERLLLELARRGDVASVVAQLAVTEHPYARALHDEAVRQQPDVLRLELAVNRTFAGRAAAAAGRADAAMQAYVQSLIDVENLWSARLLAPPATPNDLDPFFLVGGRRVTREAYLALAMAATPAARDALVAPYRADPVLQAALDADRPEDAVQDALIDIFHHVARLEPLGTAPIIRYVLMLRRQVRELHRIAWSLALAVPAERARRATARQESRT